MIALAALMAICSVRIEPITIDVATVQTASGYAVTRVIRRDGVQPDVFSPSLITTNCRTAKDRQLRLCAGLVVLFGDEQMTHNRLLVCEPGS